MKLWRKSLSETEIAFILEQIREFRNVDTEGKVSLRGSGDVENWTAVLTSAMNLNVRTDALRRQTIRSALLSPELPENFSRRDFEQQVQISRNKLEKTPQKSYRVAFPIWNKPQFLNGVKKVDGVTLNFSPSKNTRYFKDITISREKQRNDRHFSEHFTAKRRHDLERCDLCLAHVNASNYEEAIEQASQAVYQILGLTNLCRNEGKISRISFDRLGKLPVSEILIAPHTTTHESNGKITHSGFWYENWSRAPNKLNLTQEKLKAWGQRVAKFEKRIAISPWSSECNSALIRYHKAFSDPDLNAAFLNGWRLFENISGLENEKISDKIKRASNVFQDNLEYSLIAKHLQIRRNLISHGHKIEAGDDETLAFQMLHFVNAYLQYFLLNGFNFRNLKEFWDFLDLPDDKKHREQEANRIERRLELLQYAAHFRSET